MRPTGRALLLAALALGGCTYIHDTRRTSVVEVGESEDGELLEGVGSLRHRAWDDVLERYASAEGVDYDGLIADGEARFSLRQYLHMLGAVDPRLLAGREERIAFYVNQYNATVVDLVVDRLEESPAFRVDQEGFALFDEAAVELDGRLLSLNVLEHVLLRGDLGHGSASVSSLDAETGAEILALHEDLWGDEVFDPRVHFLLNCASTSCPPLQTAALVGESVGETLDSATERFLADADRGAGPEGISRLFEWFAADFAAAGYSEPGEFIGEFRSLDGVDTTRYLPYDWALNRWSPE